MVPVTTQYVQAWSPRASKLEHIRWSTSQLCISFPLWPPRIRTVSARTARQICDKHIPTTVPYKVSHVLKSLFARHSPLFYPLASLFHFSFRICPRQMSKRNSRRVFCSGDVPGRRGSLAPTARNTQRGISCNERYAEYGRPI